MDEGFHSISGKAAEVAVVLMYGLVPFSGEKQLECGILILTRIEAIAGRTSK